MSYLRLVIKLSILIVCAAGSFGGAVGFMAAKSEAAQLPISTPNDLIARKLAEESDLTGAPRRMSAIYPTTKYTHAQLAPVKKLTKAKVAVRSTSKKPMQIAYAPELRVADRATPIFAHIR
jgi:hypothetical protein